MTKKLPHHEKMSRKPISRACSFCHTKHIQCDHNRPCKNCIKRGIQSTCRDVERKKAKYLNDEDKSATGSSTTPKKRTGSIQSEKNESDTDVISKKRNQNEAFAPVLSNTDSTSTPPTGPPGIMNTTEVPLPQPHIPLGVDSQFLNASRYHPLESLSNSVSTPTNSLSGGPTPHSHIQLTGRSNSGTSGSIQQRLASKDYESSPEQFSSLFANQEYAQLADLLDSNSNMIHSPGHSSVHTTTNYANAEFQTSFQSDNNTRPYISLSDNSTQVKLSTEEDEIAISNSLNGSQEPYYTSPLILRHLIQQPEDVYTTRIQPYNYPMAYHVLLNYLKTRFKRDQLIQIAETMAEYRPSFIAATRSLVEMDLLFAERSFQRSLLEYESMSSLSSSPTIMWRRSGEIVAVSTEFSSLTSHTKIELLSKRTFIVELMSDNSALDYFKLFSSVAFGDLNGVIITECTLLTPSREQIRCASTWTVKRDVFDIPMLVVGQFLPILQVR